MTGGRRGARRRGRAVGGLAFVSVLLVGLLAVVTNLATNAIPAPLRRWTDDPWWTWGATAAFLMICALVAAVSERRRSAEGRTITPVTNLPARNAAFVGRRALLRKLHQNLTTGPVAAVAIRGLGGAGKTHLALEYAYRELTTERKPIVWWIRADTGATMMQDLAELSVALGVERKRKRKDAASSALGVLNTRSDWLLVYDDARKADVVRPWLPAGTGGIIITSRSRGWGGVAVQVDLPHFRRRESLRYLRRRVARYDRSAAHELAAVLGDLPLALAQAASYLDVYDLTVGAYLTLYRNRDTAGALLAGTIDGYPESVATTWLLHHDQLLQDAPAGLDLLRLCSFLDPDDIDLDLLLSAPDLLPPDLAVSAAAGRSPPVEGALVDTSLMTRANDRRVRVHRLVAEATRLHLTAGPAGTETVRRWAACAIALLDRLFPADPIEQTDWPRCAALSPHVISAVEHARYYDLPDSDIVAIADRNDAYLESRRMAVINLAVAARSGSWIRMAVVGIAESLLSRYERSYLRFLAQTSQVADLDRLQTNAALVPERTDMLGGAVPSGARRWGLTEMLARGDKRTLLVVGSPGSGKTTLLWQAADHAARARGRDRRIPVIVALRDHPDWAEIDGQPSLPELARRGAARLRATEPAEWWERQLGAGRCLVMLDGLDEVVDVAGRAAAVDWINRQIADFPDNKFIVTSRPHTYRADSLPDATVLVVTPFTDGQIYRSIYRWFLADEIAAGVSNRSAAAHRAEASARDLWNRIVSHPFLRDLAVNPMLLTMIVNVHRYRRALPSGLFELYREIVNVLLPYRDGTAPTRDDRPEAGLARVAFAMMRRRTVWLSRAGMAAEIGFASESPEDTAADHLVDDMVAAGLLVTRGRDMYSFAHLTIMEFLAARHVEFTGNVGSLLTVMDDPWWRQVILFFTESNGADTVVRACLDMGTSAALDLARECVATGAEVDPALLDRLRAIGDAGPEVG